MGHKSKECLKVQAQKVMSSLTQLGRSKHDDKLQAGRAYDALIRRGETLGISKQEYINNAIRDHIYSINTYSTYEKHNNYFLAYCEDKGCKTLAQCREYVPEWLNGRIQQGLSPYTVQTEAAALGKLYQCPVSEFGVDIPTRHRGDITRSRGVADRDRGFSLEKNSEIINFARGTGLRRNELESLTKEQLRYRENEAYLVVKGKGGRTREAPIVGPHRQEIIDKIERSEGLVWDKVPSHMDVHGYRSDYATAIYTAYSRDISQIPYKERYYCRGDRKGEIMDKSAMRMASEALGHSRLEVVAGHYIR